MDETIKKVLELINTKTEQYKHDSTSPEEITALAELVKAISHLSNE